MAITKTLLIVSASEHVGKTFCRTRGSNLISLYDDHPDYIGLPIGGLDQDPGALPIMHIFVGSESLLYEITDSLPQHEELPQENVV